MSIWGRAFAAMYDRMLAQSEEAGLREMRSTLLAQAQGRVVEIGAGTGLNLAHYPGHVGELVLTEPEEPMARRLRARVAETPRPARVATSPAEQLPVEDGWADTVVGTLVLCTVDDPRAALREVVRVLRPGGRYLFVEHVRSDDPGLARWQDRLERPWRAVGHGCRCNQDTASLLHASGLEVERMEPTRLPKAAKLVKPAIVGVAVR